jgi:hypothetical protein
MIPLQQDKDKTGKRFLTCYLFPQDFLRNGKDKYSIKKNVLHKINLQQINKKIHLILKNQF